MEKPSCLCLVKNLYFINPAEFFELFPGQMLENQMHKMGSPTCTQNAFQIQEWLIFKLVLCSTKTLISAKTDEDKNSSTEK